HRPRASALGCHRSALWAYIISHSCIGVIAASIPYVAFVEFDLVLSEKHAVFRLVSLRPVVFLLIRDVLFERLHSRLPDRKRAIAVLPVKPLIARAFGFEPAR